ncbi:FAD dependent oxidoreductase [Aspergillus carlsbadensis]|nr:FAD dependent oxidoreductase [Aspergillus carlsbadensis]
MANSEEDARANIRSMLLEHARRGTGLPKPYSKEPWPMIQQHALHNIRSKSLPGRVDYAVIGSGMAGCSVAWNLYRKRPDHRITVFEARGLTSGATGRSDGQVAPMTYKEFADMVYRYGFAAACEMNLFTLYNQIEMYPVAAHNIPLVHRPFMEVNLAFVDAVSNYADPTFSEAVDRQLTDYQISCEDYGDRGERISADQCKAKYHFRSSQGGGRQLGFGLMPYRLVADTWQILYQDSNGRVTIETHTPVTKVSYDAGADSHPYTVWTNRGQVRANHVIYCTNAWTSYLLPALKERIFPWRSTMSCQEFYHKPGDWLRCSLHYQKTWQEVSQPQHNYLNRQFVMGTQYFSRYVGTTSGQFKAVMVRADKMHYDTVINDDDTTDPTPINKEHVYGAVTRVFQPPRVIEDARPTKAPVWTGVTGYTADGMPIVGKLSGKWTMRAGDGEWICAGCNGMGLGKYWAMGQTLAAYITGEKPGSEVPHRYRSYDSRLDQMSIEAFLDRFLPPA